MRKAPGEAVERLIPWLSASMIISVLLYREPILTFLQGISSIVPGETQIYPIAGIIFAGAFILFRLEEIKASLKNEGGHASKRRIRLLGLMLIIFPAILWNMLSASEPMDVSAIILALAWFGAFMIFNPSTSKILAPYLMLYMAATMAPRLLYPVAGEPLADFTSLIVAGMMPLIGAPAAMTGRSLELTSLNGETIKFTISSGCSSISSITVFLLLCGLMHLDLKKNARTTLLFASIGTLSLILLNALRVVILLWVGYTGGDWSLWTVHSWLGYAIMIGFYALTAKIYLKTK
ncbi:archaeosortase/exosortase family protein [Candidatus Bathyarchaeota archaeon]|nr:archaeosortase/exosortase family protein [Candidatus Bathyarchaeota archaeon]